MRCIALVAVCMMSLVGHAQIVVDPGFESYAVSSGGFVQPSSGPWTFSNDAGVVEPFSPNSSTGTLNTWSATRAAFEGQQYASTYAGLDNISQSVTFPSAGVYRLSVEAFAPGGTLTIPGQLTNQPVTNGEFRFVFNGIVTGATHTVVAGQDWTLYSTDISVAAPGAFKVGVDNPLAASYFINYDAFSVQPIPEPVGIGLLLLPILLRDFGYIRERKKM